VAALGAHAVALGGGFIWLDHAHIQKGLALASGAGGWGRLFSEGFAGTGFYRPLVSVSLSLDAALGGAPWLYHATTLAWHGAAAVMCAVAAEALGLTRRSAVLAGVLFAAHPATSLVAAAIAFRSESMIAAALLALVTLHLKGRAGPAAAVLLAGALTKETALLLGPLIIAALELLDPARSTVDRRARARLLAAEAAAVVVAVALRMAFAPAWRAEFPPLTFGQAAGTRLASLAKSALRVVLPIDGTLCDDFAIAGILGGRAAAGAVVAVVLIVLAWKCRGPLMLFALALLPSLNLVPVMRWWSPHYLYVPLAFAAMAAAQALALGRGGRLVLAAVVLVFAGGSARSAARFRADETLWRPEVAARPACREGHFYMGEIARQGGRPQEAAEHYQRAVAVTEGVLSYVDRAAALQNLGAVRLELRQPAEAAAAFRAALAVAGGAERPRELTHNLAVAELAAGNPAEAARLLEPETDRTDARPQSILVRARALHRMGRQDEAAALIRRLPPGARPPAPR